MPVNLQNLGSFADLTAEERRAMASKAGKASVAARRARKTMREALMEAMQMPGVQDDLTAAILREAIKGNKSGSVARAWEVIRDTLGEKPVAGVQIGNLDGQPLKTMDLSGMSTEQLRALAAQKDAENEDDAG